MERANSNTLKRRLECEDLQVTRFKTTEFYTYPGIPTYLSPIRKKLQSIFLSKPLYDISNFTK
jgi:hypothetical protein